jgi:ribonuclease BN (tRNA processing enzyme)
MDVEHLNLQQVGAMATKAHVKSVLLYHFNPQDPAAFVAGIKKSFSGPVYAGADLDRYCLSAPRFGPCR